MRRENKEEQGNKSEKTKKKRNLSKLDHKEDKEIASNSHVTATVWKENNFEGLYKLQMRRQTPNERQKIEKLLKALMQGQTQDPNYKSYLREAVCKVHGSIASAVEQTSYTHQSNQQNKRSSIRCMDDC